MGKKNGQRRHKPVVETTGRVVQDINTTNQGDLMSNDPNAKKETPSTNTPESPDQKKGEAAKEQVKEGSKETKEGVIKVITGLPSMVWNKALKPAYEFLKGIVTRAWQGLVNFYHQEVNAFKDLGPMEYFLGRGGKLGLKLFKILGAAAVVAFINTILFNMTGISLFDPMTLAIIGVIAIVCVVGASYYAQKEMGGEFQAGTTGTHIVEAFNAA